MAMHIIMNDSHITSIAQLAETLTSGLTPSFVFETHDDAYAWIASVLDRFKYLNRKHLKKKEKILVRKYIARYTTYSKSQITRLIKEKQKTGTLQYGKGNLHTSGLHTSRTVIYTVCEERQGTRRGHSPSEGLLLSRRQSASERSPRPTEGRAI